MTIAEIAERLNLTPVTGEEYLHREVSDGYVSDLLSDVMANAKKDCVWITLQTHENAVAVAVLKEIAAVVIVNGRKPSDVTIEKATEQKVPILLTSKTAFEIAGKLYQLLHAEEIQS